MKPPKFTEGQVAQAIYTWSKSNVDGSAGVGFSTISGLLRQSTDWLHRLQPDAFKLYEPGLTEEEATARYEARRDFGAVGCFHVNGVGVIYRKTADGAIDAKGRPQPVVHVIMGRSDDLNAARLDYIRADFWRSQVTDADLNVELPDLTLAELVDGSPVPPDCTGGHTQAKQFLRKLRQNAAGNSVSVHLAPGETTVADILDAFPPEVHRLIALNPYVVVAGTTFKFDLTVANLYVPRQSMAATCDWRSVVRSAAERYLFTEHPSIADYADALLSSGGPRIDDVGRSEPVTTVARLLDDIRRQVLLGSKPLTRSASLEIAERLRTGGYDFQRLRDESTATLKLIFGGVDDLKGVRDWARLLYALPTEFLVDAWNDTGAPAFLGILLMRDLGSDWGDTAAVRPKLVGDQESTVSMLRLAARLSNGADNLAILIDRGFGGTEQARRIIGHAFEGQADFLFGRVLPRTRIDPMTMLDFIRSNFNDWSMYRRVPDHEAKAINEIFKPKFWQRIRHLLSVSPARLGGRRSR